MGILTGKKVLAFGDSIIDGHLYKKAGFMEFVAKQEGLELRKYANNGACILPGTPIDEEGLGGMILRQVQKAAEEEKGEEPDYVVFDGGTNDAYEPVMARLGDREGEDAAKDTFAGAFRKTIGAIQESWPDAKLIYVAVHRLGYRERKIQEELHKIELSVCARMGVAVANLYDECSLDTADEDMCRKYSFDVLKDGLPAPGESPTGTHPNFSAIKEFYLPFVADVLRRTEEFRFREVCWDSHDREIMLYWELPEQAAREGCYQIWCGKELKGETKESHYKIDGLLPDCEYEVALRAVREGREIGKVKVFCRTKKEKQRLDVTKPPYSAKGDGITLNTKSLQSAIDDCRPGQAVYLPAGTFLTGALRLHSDMEMYLEEGAVLRGTADPKDYLPRIKSRFEGIELETLSGLLNLGELDCRAGCASQNVVIRGKGTIEGGGKDLARRVIEEERERQKDYLYSLGESIVEYENADTIPGRVRPRLLHICNAQNVSVNGITLKNGACWNVHMIYSENILTYDCNFYSRNIWNGDGWDPDSSKNCVIFGCTFDTGDDAVAVKSGKNPEGNRIGRPCEHIRIFDCKCQFGHGFAIGSEMSGGIRDVRIWNCDLRNSAYGIEIKGTKKRGGYVKELYASHCIVPRILVHAVPYNDDGEAAEHPPVFEKMCFSEIEITGECLNEETGCMEPCEYAQLCGFEKEGHGLRDIAFRKIRYGNSRQRSGKIQMKYVDSAVFE